MQHILPGGQRGENAAVQRAAGSLDAVPGRGIHVVGLLVEAGQQALAQGGDRFGDARQGARKPVGGAADLLTNGESVTLQCTPARVVDRGAGQHLAPDQA